jgi:UDP-N-acetyl-D-glucosamine dehydrogenase
VKGSRVHVLGVAYKRDIDDVRESPALDVILLLRKLGAKVTYSDPYVPSIRLDGVNLCATAVDGAVEQADCVVVITNHSDFDYAGIHDKAKLIVDTRNAYRGRKSDKIVLL